MRIFRICGNALRKSTHRLSHETGEEKRSRYEHSYLPTRWNSTPLFRQIFGIPWPVFSWCRLIPRRTDFPWPPYSPDLNPCDYFLWGCLKKRIYDNNPQTLADLKDNIRTEMRRIPDDMIGRVIDNFDVRVAAVIRQGRDWIKHIINY